MNNEQDLDYDFELEPSDEPVDRQWEGCYRRGYHQAVAHVANALRDKQLSAEDLDSWVEGVGMNWRHNVRLDRQVFPPEIGGN